MCAIQTSQPFWSSSISQTRHLVALALLGQRLEERAEEAVDIRLTHQEIDSELHDVRLNLGQALGAPSLEILAGQRGAQARRRRARQPPVGSPHVHRRRRDRCPSIHPSSLPIIEQVQSRWERPTRPSGTSSKSRSPSSVGRRSCDLMRKREADMRPLPDCLAQRATDRLPGMKRFVSRIVRRCCSRCRLLADRRAAGSAPAAPGHRRAGDRARRDRMG